ncbi:hypothetical protein BGW38_008254, partial [Lunasporangiospora selenospora]
VQFSSAQDTQLQPLGSLSGHGPKVTTCSISSDGRWLASGGHDRKILIWSIPERALKYTIDAASSEGHSGLITSVRFTADDRLILGTASYDTTVRIWDLTLLTGSITSAGETESEKTVMIAPGSLKPLQILKGHSAAVKAVDFCAGAGNNHCVSFDAEGELRVWDFISGQCERSFRITTKQMYSSSSMRCHPQNPSFVVVSVGTTLYTVQINDLQSQPRAIHTTHSKNIVALDWAPQGQFLVCVWDTTQQGTPTSGTTGSTTAMATTWRVFASQQTQRVSSCAFVKSIPGNSTSTSTSTTSTSTSSSSSSSAMTATGVVYGEYEKISVWNLKTARGYMGGRGPIAELQAHPGGAVSALACSPSVVDGEHVLVLASASSYRDGVLKLWKISG